MNTVRRLFSRTQSCPDLEKSASSKANKSPKSAIKSIADDSATYGEISPRGILKKSPCSKRSSLSIRSIVGPLPAVDRVRRGVSFSETHSKTAAKNQEMEESLAHLENELPDPPLLQLPGHAQKKNKMTESASSPPNPPNKFSTNTANSSNSNKRPRKKPSSPNQSSGGVSKKDLQNKNERTCEVIPGLSCQIM